MYCRNGPGSYPTTLKRVLSSTPMLMLLLSALTLTTVKAGALKRIRFGSPAAPPTRPVMLQLLALPQPPA